MTLTSPPSILFYLGSPPTSVTCFVLLGGGIALPSALCSSCLDSFTPGSTVTDLQLWAWPCLSSWFNKTNSGHLDLFSSSREFPSQIPTLAMKPSSTYGFPFYSFLCKMNYSIINYVKKNTYIHLRTLVNSKTFLLKRLFGGGKNQKLYFKKAISNSSLNCLPAH